MSPRAEVPPPEQGPPPRPGNRDGASSPGGPEDLPFSFRCPDPARGEARALRRLSRREVRQHLINVFSGTSLQAAATAKIDVALTGLPDDTGDTTHFAEEILDTTDGHVQALIALAEALSSVVAGLPPVDHDLLSGGKCKTPGLSFDSCARGIADELGLRLMRRPPTDGEITKLRDHLAAIGAATSADAIAGAFAYLLLLPASLLHLEDSGEVMRPGQAVKISSFESMNRVYFGLVGTPPPVAVLKAMRAPDWSRLKAEQRIDELLSSSLFKARLLDFFQEWLGYGPNVDLGPLPARMTAGLMPKDLPAEAFDEIKAFVAATVLTGRGTFTDLMTSNKVHYLSPNLAKIYGLPAPAVKGPQPTPTMIDGSRHSGLLGRVSMNLHVEPQTSPIGRGVRVKRKLYCEDIHVPPDLNVAGGEIKEIADPTQHSNRALVENRTSPAFCQACHRSINQIGFALDFYDPVGRYRTEELRFDDKGNLVNTFALATDVGTPQTVAQALVASERGSACLVSQWLSFSAQRDKWAQEGCLHRALHEKVRSGGTGILEMLRHSARAEIEAIRDIGGIK